jgi:hypothetical protein
MDAGARKGSLKMSSRSRYIFFAVAVLTTFALSPAQAQINDTYVIPVVASTSGANNTVWSSEFNVWNPHQHDLTVSIVYLPTLTGDPLEVLLDVFPNENFSVESVLPEFFERNGTGSLLVATFPEDNPGIPDDILERSFLVNTKTFNNASSGTFGQLVPGTWTGLLDFETDQISSVAHGIRNGGNFRTNVGAANLGSRTAVLRIDVYDAEGNKVGNQLPFTIPFYGHLQDRLPIAVDHGTVEFFLDDPSQEAVVFPYVSIIDNRSGDAVYMNPTLLAEPSILFKYKNAGREIGKKLSNAEADKVADRAKRIGHAKVVRGADGEKRLEWISKK